MFTNDNKLKAQIHYLFIDVGDKLIFILFLTRL